jgi:hypothetical protein
MDEAYLRDLLTRLAAGEETVDEALEELRALPYRDIGIAHLDTHRGLRARLGEVVFAAGKSIDQLTVILRHLEDLPGNVLVTRLDPAKAAVLAPRFPAFEYDPEGRYFVCRRRPVTATGRGVVRVVTAGTADIGVGREAAVVLELMGQEAEIIADVGVAGLHRLLAYRERLTTAAVLIVVAGMEGALPSVVAGLVDRPVIAVPTSIGYGASFNGLAALLGMLNSCAGGVGVVNIDNGFGAGYLAGLINRRY